MKRKTFSSPAGHRAVLEAMEVRRLLSTVVVNTLADETIANSTTSLREAITIAAAGDTIQFQPGLNGTITLGGTQLEIDRNVTISGPGAAMLKVSGNDASRVFDVAAGATVSISGLAITKGRSESGGGIYNAGSLTLSNCVVSNNLAKGLDGVPSDLTAGSVNPLDGSAARGGGIYNAGVLSLTATTLSANHAVGGDGAADASVEPMLGGVGGEGLGGAIYSTAAGVVTLASSTLSQNLAIGGRGNVADGGAASGGAIYHIGSGALTVTGCTLSGNQAAGGTSSAPGSQGFGGGAARGGAIFSDVGNLAMTGGALMGNTAVGGAGSRAIDDGGDGGDAVGGALHTRSAASVLQVSLSNNAATGGDGGFPYELNITGTGDGGEADGGAIKAFTDLALTACTFVGNRANGGHGTEGGGALGGALSAHGNTRIATSTFLGNAATGIADFGGWATGGAVFHQDGTITITDSTLAGNQAVGRPEGGGWGSPGASAYGGAISASDLTVNGSTLSGNAARAGQGGSAMEWRGMQWSAGNGGTTTGGAIFLYLGGSATLTRSTLSGNSAIAGAGGDGWESPGMYGGSGGNARGGALNTAADVTFTACTLAGNAAVAGARGDGAGAEGVDGKSFGGGVSHDVHPLGALLGSLKFANTLIATNSADTGLDIYGPATSQGFNLIGKADASTGWIASDRRGTVASPLNPGLGPLAHNGGLTKTMALLGGSPALDAGKAFGLTVDQRGSKRPINLASAPNATGGDGSDIGAFELQALVPAQTPFKHFAIGAAPVTIEAEEFDSGGEAVGYHDAEPQNFGGNVYPRHTDGVDVQYAKDPEGPTVLNVGWCKPGEWLEYTVDVQTAGTYAVDFRVASPAGGGTFHLEVDGNDVSGALTVPNTGGWQTWKTITRTGVSLAAGRHVLRLALDAAAPATGSVCNFNWFRFSAAEPVTLATNTAAHVRDGTFATQNFGTRGVLEVKKSTPSWSREAFVKFDLSSVASINSATLRVFGKLSGAGSMPIGVWAAGNTWTEGAITWNGRPATVGAERAAFSVSGTTAKWYEIDLPTFLKAEKAAGRNVVTLVLKAKATSTSQASFSSDETSSGPQLVIGT